MMTYKHLWSWWSIEGCCLCYGLGHLNRDVIHVLQTKTKNTDIKKSISTHHVLDGQNGRSKLKAADILFCY